MTIAATWQPLSQQQTTTECCKKKITEVHKTVSGGKSLLAAEGTVCDGR